MSNPGDDDKKDLSSLISLPPEPTESSPEEAPVEAPLSFDPPSDFAPLDQSFASTDAPPTETQIETLVEAPTEIINEAQSEIPTQVETQIATQVSEPLDSIRSFSENIVATQVAASFPFTLKIEGKLTDHEAEKLVSILDREKMGIREVDLESQIAEGKILIPRISEYAGILLIQALRGVSAKISFGPSDEIFSTADTRDEITGLGGIQTAWSTRDTQAEAYASKDIPVSNSDHLPQFEKIEVLDTVIASGLLTTKSVEAASSKEYDSLLEGLIRELKFKAKRRGANGIISLEITLTPLTLPTDYRVTVSASAVRGN